MSSKSVELRKVLQEISAMEAVIATKQRMAGRLLLEIQELHPADWRQRARINGKQAKELLESVTQTDPSRK